MTSMVVTWWTAAFFAQLVIFDAMTMALISHQLLYVDL